MILLHHAAPIRRKIFQFHLRSGARRKPQNNNRRNSSSLLLCLISSRAKPLKNPPTESFYFLFKIYDCFPTSREAARRGASMEILKTLLGARKSILPGKVLPFEAYFLLGRSYTRRKVHFDVLRSNRTKMLGPSSNPLNFIPPLIWNRKEIFCL